MLSTQLMLRKHGADVGAVVITTKLPSQKSNLVGVWDMFRGAGYAYTHYKLLTNVLLPMRLKRMGLCVSVTGMLQQMGHNPEVIVCSRADEPQVIERIKRHEPDVLLSAGATHKFLPPLLEVPRMVAVNLHTSLLPRYAGVDPQFWALQRGEREAGVTLHVTAKKLDVGDIVNQHAFSLVGVTSVMRVLMNAWEHANAILDEFYSGKVTLGTRRPQDVANRSFFKRPNRADVAKLYADGKCFYTSKDVADAIEYAREVNAAFRAEAAARKATPVSD